MIDKDAHLIFEAYEGFNPDGLIGTAKDYLIYFDYGRRLYGVVEFMQMLEDYVDESRIEERGPSLDDLWDASDIKPEYDTSKSKTGWIGRHDHAHFDTKGNLIYTYLQGDTVKFHQVEEDWEGDGWKYEPEVISSVGQSIDRRSRGWQDEELLKDDILQYFKFPAGELTTRGIQKI